MPDRLIEHFHNCPDRGQGYDGIHGLGCGCAYEPSDAEVRGFANTYGYSLDEARHWLARNGPDRRYWHGREDARG